MPCSPSIAVFGAAIVGALAVQALQVEQAAQQPPWLQPASSPAADPPAGRSASAAASGAPGLLGSLADLFGPTASLLSRLGGLFSQSGSSAPIGDYPTYCTATDEPMESAFHDIVNDWEGLPLKPGTAPLPLNLQGLYWFQNQTYRSKLVTFGYSDGEVGTGCSTGELGPEGEYCIRTAGDKVWAYGAPTDYWSATDPLRYLFYCDNSYNFKFNLDPQTGLVVDGLITGQSCQAFSLFCKAAEVLVNAATSLKMDAIEDPRYPGSYVYHRSTSLFGIIPLTTLSYDLVQVVDAQGAKIHPAWDMFMQDERGLFTNGTSLWYGIRS